ncbi:MAG: HAD family hydrolase [Melioribacteraceae bacterium]|nr:HAD family hydrolase [Melioribacteraceae bacterium]
MAHRAVFLDRDNTLIFDPGYLKDSDSVELLPGVAEGLNLLKNQYNFKLIVVSNQSGITRGLITREDVEKVNTKINNLLSLHGASIDSFYFCPYHPDFDSSEKTVCRKPSPYMIVKAAEDHNIDLSGSYMIGDSVSDIECGINAGVMSILFNYNNYSSEQINVLIKDGKTPNFVTSNFLEACNYIAKDYSRR